MKAQHERIGVRELRQHASRYLDRVEQGQSIEITRHGRPVAILVAAAPSRQPLIERGILEPADDPGDLLDVVPAPPLPPGTTTASEQLARMRDEEPW